MGGFLLFENLTIKSSRRDYVVEFGSAKIFLTNNLSESDVVLIDQNVRKLYPHVIPDSFPDQRIIEICPSEDAKSYRAIGYTIDQIVKLGISKTQRIVAIGGGITQDISSFSSSILMRGISWIFLPTNLLTQCDSCIGSKNSVNTDGGKNLLGGFWPPDKICIDFEFLRTITAREIKSGIGEMLHYFFSAPTLPKDLYLSLEHITVDRFGGRSHDILTKLIIQSLEIKRPMVEIDEFDTGPRNIFNFGHSFGHALEKATGYQIPHGIAVAYGMRIATKISLNLGMTDDVFYSSVRELTKFALIDESEPSFLMDDFISALRKDKKNSGKQINVILTEGQGKLKKCPIQISESILEVFRSELLLK